MTFTLPVMNLAVNIWRDPGLTLPMPPVTAPDVVTVGNLTPGRRVTHNTGSFGNEMYLLMPPATLIFDGSPGPAWGLDIVEVPAASGRYYRCFYADNVASGFSNQHVLAVLQKARAFGSGNGYVPPPGPPPGPPTAIRLGTATTGGVAQNTMSIGVTPPSNQDVVIYIAVWNGGLFGPSIPGFANQGVASQTFGGTPSGVLYCLRGHLLAGPQTLTATLAGGTLAPMQSEAWGLPFATATLDRTQSANGTLTNGSINDITPGSHSNEYYLASYLAVGGTNCNVSGVWVTLAGTEQTDTISGQTCRLNTSGGMVATPSPEASACLLGPYTRWAGLQNSWF